MLQTREILGNMPASISRECPAGDRFHYWLGHSGKRYLHTVFTVDECPGIENALFVAVKRDSRGHRQAIATGNFGTAPDLVMHGTELAEARRRGANELHLHLMACGPAERHEALRDITSRHLIADTVELTSEAA